MSLSCFCISDCAMNMTTPSFIISDIDDCVSVNCHNLGTCIDGVNDYNCSYTPGYTGLHCETGKYCRYFPHSIDYSLHEFFSVILTFFFLHVSQTLMTASMLHVNTLEPVWMEYKNTRVRA